MKIHNGFISNSSSSSFIIAGKPGKPLQVQITIDIPFDDVITTEEGFRDYLEDKWELEVREYGSLEKLLEKEPCLRDLYKQALFHINRGETIYTGRISNQSGTATDLLYDFYLKDVLSPEFTVLESG